MLRFTQNAFYIVFIIILGYTALAQDTGTTTTTTTTSTTKYPNEEMGIGFQIGNPGQVGVVGTFALNPDLYIGTHFGFIYASSYKTGVIEYDATNIIVFAPFAKLFLSPMKSFRPFIKGSFEIITGDYNIQVGS